MVLSRTEIDARLKEHPGWTVDGAALVRQFTFPAFADAVAFVTRLGFDAEAADHHPDLVVSFRKVTVRWSTHSEGGVTDRDFTGIEQSDRAATRLGAGR